MKFFTITTLLIVYFLSATPALSRQVKTISLKPFGTLSVYVPDGEAKSVALFISGDGGWNEGVINIAEHIAAQGALVVGIDIVKYYKSIKYSGASCFYPAGDLENLSMVIQRRFKLKQYLKPILVGYSSGATLVYGTMAQAPSNTFKGGISLGFCPDIEIGKPLCKGSGLTSHIFIKNKSFYLEPCTHLTEPFTILQGVNDKVCSMAEVQRFIAGMPMGELVSLEKVGHGFSVEKNWLPQLITTYKRIVLEPSYAEKKSAPKENANNDFPKDIPLSIIPAVAPNDLPLVLFISGDGGWTNFDQSIAEKLAEDNISVIGLDSQRYFWDAKNPKGTAEDMAKVLSHFMQQWNKKSLIIAGYSFGAGVAPFITQNLPDELRRLVKGVCCISPDKTADFEIHISDMLNMDNTEEYNVITELKQLKPLKTVCLFGDEESVELRNCFANAGIKVSVLPGSHHFNDNYKAVATIIKAAGQ